MIFSSTPLSTIAVVNKVLVRQLLVNIVKHRVLYQQCLVSSYLFISSLSRSIISLSPALDMHVWVVILNELSFVIFPETYLFLLAAPLPMTFVPCVEPCQGLVAPWWAFLEPCQSLAEPCRALPSLSKPFQPDANPCWVLVGSLLACTSHWGTYLFVCNVWLCNKSQLFFVVGPVWLPTYASIWKFYLGCKRSNLLLNVHEWCYLFDVSNHLTLNFI